VPTTAAAQFARDLIAVGHDVYNFGSSGDPVGKN